MTFKVAGHEFARETLTDEDELGYTVYWNGHIPALLLTNWGRSESKLGDGRLPVAFVGNSESAPSPSQQQALEWLCSHLAEAQTRIQTACEDSWKECYYWEGNEMTEDDEYCIAQIRIPPSVRDTASSPAMIVVDLEQDWEMEHGFYVVLDPSNPERDCWTTWDGMSEMGLVVDDDE